MTNRVSTKRALVLSLLSMLLCISMLIGSTYAWFTDTATTAVNKIQAGTLDVALEMSTDNGVTWTKAEGKTLNFMTTDNPAEILWEPGCTYALPLLRVVNKGNLAIKYKVMISGINGDAELNDVIDWTIGDVADGTERMLAPNDTAEFTITGKMSETAGNAYQGMSIDGISIMVYATQAMSEKDSNGNTYDENAQYPVSVESSEDLIAALKRGGEVTVSKNVTLDGIVTNGVVNPNNEAQLKDVGTIDLMLNGTITSGNLSNTWGCMRVMPGTKLVISAGKNGKFINTKSWSAINVCGGEVVVNGGYFESAGTCFFVYTDSDEAVSAKSTKLTINGGIFKSNSGVIENSLGNNATVIINGGTFIGWNPSAYLGAGHTVTENNGVWTVQ